MQTYGTITITIPFKEGGYDFEELRDRLSQTLKKEVPKTTLHDWIKKVCELRDCDVYSDTYSEDELGALLEWLTFRNHYGPKLGAKKYRQHLDRKHEAENDIN